MKNKIKIYFGIIMILYLLLFLYTNQDDLFSVKNSKEQAVKRISSISYSGIVCEKYYGNRGVVFIDIIDSYEKKSIDLGYNYELYNIIHKNDSVVKLINSINVKIFDTDKNIKKVFTYEFKD